jgi:hypothetical protein
MAQTTEKTTSAQEFIMVRTQSSSGSMSGCWLAQALPQAVDSKAAPEQAAAAPRCAGCGRALSGIQATVTAFVVVLVLTGLVGLAISGLLPVVLIAAALLLPALAPLLLVVLGLLASQTVKAPTQKPDDTVKM